MTETLLNSETKNTNVEGTQSNFLVTTKSNSNKGFCGRWLLVNSKSSEGLFSHSRVFCNRYGCKICGERKRWLVCKAMAKTIQEKALRVFATLTIKPESCDSADSVRYIKDTWNKHRTYQKRELPRLPSFISVVEFQKHTKNAHLHVLMDQFVPFQWLSDSWQAVGGGRVNVKAADVRAAKYMSKYLTKELESTVYGKFRRVSTSRDIKLLPKKSNPDFEFIKVAETEARLILGKSVIKDLKWGNKLVTGFLANRPLTTLKDPLMLRNVMEAL